MTCNFCNFNQSTPQASLKKSQAQADKAEKLLEENAAMTDMWEFATFFCLFDSHECHRIFLFLHSYMVFLVVFIYLFNFLSITHAIVFSDQQEGDSWK